MKPSAILLAWAAAWAMPLAAQEAPADEMAEARAIIAVMFPPQSRDVQMHGMMAAVATQLKDGMGAQLQAGDAGLNAIIDGYLAALPDTLMPLVREHFPQILEATAGAYTREFSLAELQELRRFAGTPTGAHYFSRTTALLGDPAVSAANARYFRELQALQKVETEKLKEKVMNYLSNNPEALKKLSSSAKD